MSIITKKKQYKYKKDPETAVLTQLHISEITYYIHCYETHAQKY